MKYDPHRHHRQSIRLRGYDYSLPGSYFITICVQDRICLFGKVVGEEVITSDQGKMIKRWWYELPNKYPNLELGECIIMPNHLHGIVIIRGTGQTHRSAPTVGANLGVRPETVSRMVQWFKTMTTNEYIQAIKIGNWPQFNKRVWQRNYYEHIIRDEQSFNNIQQYIRDNPRKWQYDELYKT